MERRKVLSIREVITIKGNIYTALKNNIQDIVAGKKEKMEQQRLLLPISYSEFCDLFISFGTHCLYNQNQKQCFIIDEYNETIIKQLYLYITVNPDFDGDLSKGIMLQGKYGCGKTIILETYTLIQNYIVQKFGLELPLFTFIKSVNLQEQITKQSIGAFMYKPLVIDEFG